MPNGHDGHDAYMGYDERGWAIFRERTLDALTALKVWTEKHEVEEFEHHKRIEEHMSETKAHIAASSVGRDTVDRRLAEIERDQRVLYGKISNLANRVWWLVGITAVAGSVAGIVVVYILQHTH